jgi:hypothetical protein
MSDDNNYDNILADLQIETARQLLNKVKSGEATAADLNVARQLLKDNNVGAPPGANKQLDELHKKIAEKAMPHFDDEDDVTLHA